MSKRICTKCGGPKHRQAKGDVCRKCLDGASLAEGLVVTGDRAEATARSARPVRTLADLIRVCQIDTREWTIERWVANKWDAAGGDVAYQVKAFLVRNVAGLRAQRTLDALLADAGRTMPRWDVKRPTRPKSGYALELAIPDLHIGKLAWARETGEADYDGAIAERLYRQAVETLLERTKGFVLDRVVLPIGNDFFHSDTKAGTTYKGTPLDNDSRWHKSFERGRRLLVDTIDRLQRRAAVDVIVVPGNHSPQSEFSVGAVLEAWYRNTKGVVIHNDPIPRKYLRWGSVLLMFTHGDKGKRANYPLVMATERPEDFGATRFREVHTGHFHETKTQEFHGVRVRTSPALCPADAWHSENHFIGQQRGAEAFVWHKRDGLVAQAFYTVRPRP
jgi:hypothetical protein